MAHWYQAASASSAVRLHPMAPIIAHVTGTVKLDLNHSLYQVDFLKKKADDWSIGGSHFPRGTFDCGIQSLAILNKLEDPLISLSLAQRCNTRSYGLDHGEVLEYLRAIDKTNVYIAMQFNISVGIPEIIGVFSELDNNKATILFLIGKPGIPNHIVIIFRSNNNLYIFDPQQNKYYNDLNLYANFFAIYKVDSEESMEVEENPLIHFKGKRKSLKNKLKRSMRRKTCKKRKNKKRCNKKSL